MRAKKSICVCAPVGWAKKVHRPAQSPFGLLAHQGCGRIALITLHSGAQTHTHSAVLPAQICPEAHPHSSICLSLHAHTIMCTQTQISVCGKLITPNKNSMRYKSELLYHSVLSAMHCRRLPSVSPAMVSSLSSSYSFSSSFQSSLPLSPCLV